MSIKTEGFAFNSCKDNRGQTLLETLAAMGIGVIVLSAVVVIVVTSLYNVQFSKMQSLATQYAQEGLEVTRQIRNADYGTFAGFNGNYCLAAGSTQLTIRTGVQCPLNITDSDSNEFAREITAVRGDANCGGGNNTKVIGRVFWTDSKCRTQPLCHKVELATCLTDFTVAPTP